MILELPTIQSLRSTGEWWEHITSKLQRPKDWPFILRKLRKPDWMLITKLSRTISRRFSMLSRSISTILRLKNYKLSQTQWPNSRLSNLKLKVISKRSCNCRKRSRTINKRPLWSLKFLQPKLKMSTDKKSLMIEIHIRKRMTMLQRSIKLWYVRSLIHLLVWLWN